MKKRVKKASKKRISSTKLMFLSFMLLFIIVEAIYVLKAQTSTSTSQVAGVSTSK